MADLVATTRFMTPCSLCWNWCSVRLGLLPLLIEKTKNLESQTKFYHEITHGRLGGHNEIYDTL